jgi:hypothetical protein
MRIATLILGIVLMLIVGAQSCAVSFGGEVFEDRSAAEGGAVGIFMALLMLLERGLALWRGVSHGVEDLGLVGVAHKQLVAGHEHRYPNVRSVEAAHAAVSLVNQHRALFGGEESGIHTRCV